MRERFYLPAGGARKDTTPTTDEQYPALSGRHESNKLKREKKDTGSGSRHVAQQMNQLKFDCGMTMGRVFLKRVRMDNGHPIHYMRVSKECDTCHVRYK